MATPSGNMGVRKFIDAGLAREIDATMAIDEHAHPLPLGMEPEGDPERPIQPYDLALPVRLRPTNPEYVDAWAALWGYEHRDFELKHLQDLMAKKKSVVTAQRQGYNVWVLDQLKIETMITMAYGPGPTEPAPRYRFCGFCDWLLWPVPTIPEPDYGLIKNYFVVQKRMFGEIGCAALPATLAGYVSDVIEATVAFYRRRKAVGLKFQTPYYRDLNFTDVSAADAAALYAKGVKQGGLAPNELKALQDHLFRQIMRVAGETNEIVQMHTGLGVRPHFNVAGSNPLLMEPIFHEYRDTRFLLLHGGWPFDREVVALLSLDNVFTDFSCANIYKYARELSHQIRPALEWFPEKIMYGTDAYSDRSIGMLAGVPVRPNPLSGWEEKAWLMDRVGRDALGLALTGMMEDGAVTGARASELARMTMRETAVGVYGLA